MPLRTAVVGAGVVSTVHLDGIARNPRTELVGVCDLDESRARDRAAEYNTIPYFDLDELLTEADLDWLRVCTPVQTHLDVASTAVEAGVPVLIEKPVTVTTAEFDELRDVADANGVPFSTVHNHNFTPAMREAMARIRRGDLGRVRGVTLVDTGTERPDEVHRGAWARALVGGEFEEGLPHPIYPVLRAGGYPRDADAVRATTALAGDYEEEYGFDGVQLQYETADGVLCSVTSLGGSVPQKLMHVHGDRASLTVDFVSQTLVGLDRDYHASSLAKALNNADRILDRASGTLDNVRSVAERAMDDSWERAAAVNDHFRQQDAEARALLDGEQPAVPPAEARWTIRLMEAAREASSSRETSAPAGR